MGVTGALGRVDSTAKRLGSWAAARRAICHPSVPGPTRQGWLREQLSPRCPQKGEGA